jgi:hypothetical protein
MTLEQSKFERPDFIFKATNLQLVAVSAFRKRFADYLVVRSGHLEV